LAVKGFLTTSRAIERDLKEFADRFALTVDDSIRLYGCNWARDANSASGVFLLSPSACRAHLDILLCSLVLQLLLLLIGQCALLSLPADRIELQ